MVVPASATEGVRVEFGLDALDRDKVARFVREMPWRQDIGHGTLDQALDGSLCASAFVGEEQVGFCRAVTDRATFCWIDDVYVDPQCRRMGVARTLVNALLEHPQLNSVVTWLLSSSNPDARRVFESLGFAPLETTRAGKLMARPKVHNYTYQS